jgi:cystathionine beta-synthase
VVKESTPIVEISALVSKDQAAVLVALDEGGFHIITRHDLIAGMK